MERKVAKTQKIGKRNPAQNYKETKIKFGMLKGKIKIAKDFDAPLPEDLRLKCDCFG
jgi:hypothetical protein